jgi:hypothetical protein
MKRIVWALTASFALLALPSREAVQAAAIRPLTFDEVVGQAKEIVRGRVLEMRSYARGVGVVRNEGRKQGQLPLAQSPAGGSPEAAQSAGTRGGRMIFTHVVVRVDEALKGASQRVEFDVAGGTLDGKTVWIPGMPKFDRGADYVLFLREGYADRGDPIVGVRQGFFRLASDGGPSPAVLNADFDYVIGIEESKVVPRHNPRRGALQGRERPLPQLGQGPLSDAGATAQASPAARRYLSSAEPPLTVDQFVAAIRARVR